NSDLRINWYDSQSNDGDISYQDAVNDKIDMYVERADDGVYSVDEFFLNYNWNVNKIDTTVSTMKKHDHSPHNAYTGFELQQNLLYTVWINSFYIIIGSSIKLTQQFLQRTNMIIHHIMLTQDLSYSRIPIQQKLIQMH